MTNKIIPGFLYVLIVSTVFGGCSSARMVKPSSTLVTTTDNTPTSGNQSSTTTLAPTSNLTFSASPIIATPISTLSAVDAYPYIHYLMGNAKACHLPCWLGVTPGISDTASVQEQINRFSGIKTSSTYNFPAGDWLLSGFTFHYPSDPSFEIEVRSSYLSLINETTISVSEFYTRTYLEKNGVYGGDIYGYKSYNDFIRNYSLTGILSDYGIPDYIYIDASLRGDRWPDTPVNGDYFRIQIWYPDQGIFMKYNMSVTGSGNNYRFCPTDALVSGILIPSSQGDTFQKILLKLGDDFQGFFPPSKYVKTTEEAFGMTLNEFYQLFRSPSDHCLETPKAIWWPK